MKKIVKKNCGKQWQCSPLPHFTQLPSNLPILTLDSLPPQPLPNHLIPMHTHTHCHPCPNVTRLKCHNELSPGWQHPPTSRHHWPNDLTFATGYLDHAHHLHLLPQPLHHFDPLLPISTPSIAHHLHPFNLDCPAKPVFPNWFHRSH